MDAGTKDCESYIDAEGVRESIGLSEGGEGGEEDGPFDNAECYQFSIGSFKCVFEYVSNGFEVP